MNASYSETTTNLYFNNHFVNNSTGFVGPGEMYTNIIDGFWSHLKVSMKKENEIKRETNDNRLVITHLAVSF